MPISHQLRYDLNQIVGEAGLLPDDQLAHYCIDGVVPKAVVFPSTTAEIQDVLIYAADRKLSVIPSGNGTKLGFGNPPEKVDLVLSMSRLNQVLEYEPADLTVTVQAGIRLADFQAKLAENGQWLPLDPPYTDRATIGGIIAANSSGPSRLRYGTARDVVIGLQIIQPNASVAKSGGKVVKNVAGYDLNKLYVGSFGTLGIITEVTFKLSPLPEMERTVLLTFREIGQGANVALEITGSQLLPTFLNLFNGVPLTEISEPCLLIGFDGHPETVRWQMDQVRAIAKQNGAVGVEVYEGERQRALRAAMRAFPESSFTPRHTICRANLRMTDVEDFINATLAFGNELQGSVQVMGLMGNGIVYIAFSDSPKGTDELQSVANAIARLRDNALEVGGNLIVESAPTELKRQIDVWGP
ncbi:FAD-binding oxidoreductase, partial [Candidatus Poribacteria bacterium]|nr:FAD-binding oxidoreductase [Candidatus Poribacteria bacterium]